MVCISSKLLIYSNQFGNNFFMDSSENCLVSNLLHVMGPFVEKADMIR